MRSMLRMRVFHLAGIGLFLLQMAGVPAVMADASVSKYRICPHTKARFLRGNPCPCGHKHGQDKNVLKIHGQHSDCDSNDDENTIRRPGFESFVFTYLQISPLYTLKKGKAPLKKFNIPSGTSMEPPDIPS